MRNLKNATFKIVIISFLLWPLSYVSANDISKINADLLHQQLQSLGETQLPPMENSQQILQFVDNYVSQIYQILYSENDHLDAHIYTNDTLSKRNILSEMRSYMQGQLNLDNYYNGLEFLISKREGDKTSQNSSELNLSYRVYLHVAVIDYLKYLESDNISDLKKSLKSIQRIKTFKEIKDVHFWDFVISAESALVSPELTNKSFAFYVKDFWNEFVLKHEKLSSSTVMKNGDHDLKHYYLTVIDFVLSKTLSVGRDIDLNSLSGIFLQLQKRISPNDEKNIDNIKFFRISETQTGNNTDQFLLTNAVASHYRKTSMEQILLYLDESNVQAAEKEYAHFKFLSSLIGDHSRSQKSIVKMIIDVLELKIKLHQRYAQTEKAEVLLDDVDGQFVTKASALFKVVNSGMKSKTPADLTGALLFNIEPKPEAVQALLASLGYLGNQPYGQFLSDMHTYLERLTAYQLLLDQYYDVKLRQLSLSQNDYNEILARKFSNLDISSDLMDFTNRTNFNLVTLTSFNDFYLLNRNYSNLLLSETSSKGELVNNEGLFRLLQGIEMNPFALTTDYSGTKSSVFLKYIDIMSRFTDQASYRRCLYLLADNLEASKDILKLQDYDYWEEGNGGRKVETQPSEFAAIDQEFTQLTEELVEFLRADLVDKEAFQKYHDFINSNLKISNIAKVPANMLSFYAERNQKGYLMFQDGNGINFNAFKGCTYYK